MEKIKFEDEVELKKFLARDKFFYGEIGCSDMYVVTYRDNKAGTPLATSVVESPIVAIRRLGSILQEVKLPIEDVDIQLVLAYCATDSSKKPILFKDYIILSPYLYYTKKDSGHLQAKQQAENNK